MIRAVEEVCPEVYKRTLSIYETSYYGATFDFLRKYAGALQYSEFFERVPLGVEVGGVRNEDLQRLTFADAQFDLVTSNQVFEHIPDDLAAFREVYRVLKPGGIFLMMVPLKPGRTETKAQLVDGAVKWLGTPEYHDSRHSGPNSAPVFRVYGEDDVTLRTARCGFAMNVLREYVVTDLQRTPEKVVVCRK